MSTRAQVIVRNSGVRDEWTTYYKHHDGHAHRLGVRLIQIAMDIAETKTPDDFASMTYVESVMNGHFTLEFENEGRGFDPHGDIEYVYIVDFCDGIRVHMLRRPSFAIATDLWSSWPMSMIFWADVHGTNEQWPGRQYAVRKIDLVR